MRGNGLDGKKGFLIVFFFSFLSSGISQWKNAVIVHLFILCKSGAADLCWKGYGRVYTVGEERRGKFMTYPRTYILSLNKTIKGPIASSADSVIMCKCKVYACIQSGGIESGTMDQSGHIYSTGEYLLTVFMHFRTCFRTQLE